MMRNYNIVGCHADMKTAVCSLRNEPVEFHKHQPVSTHRAVHKSYIFNTFL